MFITVIEEYTILTFTVCLTHWINCFKDKLQIVRNMTYLAKINISFNYYEVMKSIV